MKRIILLALSTLTLTGCGLKSQPKDAAAQAPVTDVEVTTVAYGQIDKEIELTAVTVFLKKNAAAAPVSAFITACYVQPGTAVRRGQTLYRLESKERQALGNDILGKDMGIVLVKAGASGIVTDVQQQTGGYVTEGATLCSIANTGSMVFEVEVPAEDMRYARPGTACKIMLPDGRHLAATLSAPLATMDVNAQVQQVPAHVKISTLPEGLRAKAMFSMSSGKRSTQILPKAAVQSDDNMTSFWIMKVSPAGTAKKIPVTIGNSNNSETEIIAPRLSPADRIITTGSYQLQDGDKVVIMHNV